MLDKYAGIIIYFVIGFFSGLLLSICVLAINDKTIDKINKCEKTLPRNQRCILIAVPEKPADG